MKKVPADYVDIFSTWPGDVGPQCFMCNTGVDELNLIAAHTDPDQNFIVEIQCHGHVIQYLLEIHQAVHMRAWLQVWGAFCRAPAAPVIEIHTKSLASTSLPYPVSVDEESAFIIPTEIVPTEDEMAKAADFMRELEES